MGIFETILWNGREMINARLHLERLLHGMEALQLLLPENFRKDIIQQAADLLQKNGHRSLARLRLSVFSTDKGWPPGNASAGYLMQSFALDPLPAAPPCHSLGIYPLTKKTVDEFSGLKHNNYMRNVMASKYTADRGWGEAVLLNSFGRVCETITGNIFIVMNGNIFTPPLSEGCVAGTMRQWLLNEANNLGIAISEKEMLVEDLNDAEEIFSSNSIKLIMSHPEFAGRNYGSAIAHQIYEALKVEFRL